MLTGSVAGGSCCFPYSLSQLGMTHRSQMLHEQMPSFELKVNIFRENRLFLAIDPRAVGMGDAVRAGVRQLAAQISGDPSAGGVRVPGRRRAELAAEARRCGVEVPRPVLDRLEWPL